MTADVLVIGTGLAGTVAARYFAEAGKKVLVTERLPYVGGLTYDYKNEAGITVHAHGPHIFHTDDLEVWNFILQYTKMHQFQHRVMSYINGKVVPFPINRTTLNEVLGTTLTKEEVPFFLSSQRNPADFSYPFKSFKDVIISRIGKSLYELFFKNYTIKQWGVSPEELPAEFATRIAFHENDDDWYFKDKYQGVPIPGYTALICNMLNHPNILISLGTNYFTIRDQVSVGLTVYTGEIDQYFNYKYGRLEYRSLRFELRTLDLDHYQEAGVVNYPNDYDWTRITEYKYFTGESSPRTTIGLEYPKSAGKPYYIIPTETNLKKQELYLKEAARLESSGRYIFLGRLAECKYYNMDQVVKAALTKSKKYIDGRGS
jgi:UDP-galactopyranose mutase